MFQAAALVILLFMLYVSPGPADPLSLFSREPVVALAGPTFSYIFSDDTRGRHTNARRFGTTTAANVFARGRPPSLLPPYQVRFCGLTL